MTTITIIQHKTTSEKELVAIPRAEYEALVRFKKAREFTFTTTQKKALQRAENNFNRGKTLSYDDLAKKLGFTHRS